MIFHDAGKLRLSRYVHMIISADDYPGDLAEHLRLDDNGQCAYGTYFFGTSTELEKNSAN